LSTTVARLQAILSADTGQFDRAMDKSESRMQRVSGGIQKATLPAMAAIGALAVGAKSSIDAASDLGEQMNKTAVVFGANGREVQRWSKGLVKNFGISQRAALEAAGTYGNMLKPMGIMPGKVKEISTRMVELAGDMASFNNASPEETLQALRAGLAGETEPLRKFGVFLNEAAIQAQAVSGGIVKLAKDTTLIKQAQLRAEEAQRRYTEAVKEHGLKSHEAQRASVALEVAEHRLGLQLAGKVPKLNAAEKALATYQIITKSTKDAQGDFARTSGSVANQQRIQAAETENLRAKMGQGLLPTYQAMQKAVINLTGFFSRHTTATKIGVGVVAALAAGVLVVNAGFAVYTAAVRVAAAAQVVFNAALAANPIGLVVIAIAALAAGVLVAYKRSETFRNIVNGLWDKLKQLGGWIREHWGTIGAIVEKSPMVVAFKTMRSAVDRIVDGIKWLIDHIPKMPKLPSLPSLPFGDAHDPQKGIGFNLMGANPVMAPFAAAAAGFGLQVTSGLRPGAITANGTPSDHGIGKALDVAGSAQAMAGFFKSLVGNRAVKQAFYDPLGSIFGGAWSSYREGGHSDHVHVATYDKGGVLKPGLTLAYNGTGRDEYVTKGQPILVQLNLDGHAIARALFDPLKSENARQGRLGRGLA
jgi:hypothetical protein